MGHLARRRSRIGQGERSVHSPGAGRWFTKGVSRVNIIIIIIIIIWNRKSPIIK